MAQSKAHNLLILTHTSTATDEHMDPSWCAHPRTSSNVVYEYLIVLPMCYVPPDMRLIVACYTDLQPAL